jgi:hypothetical protein
VVAVGVQNFVATVLLGWRITLTTVNAWSIP